MSQAEGWTELTAKYKDHHATGVPTIVIADPYEHAIFTVDTRGNCMTNPSPWSLRSRCRPESTEIDFRQLFAALD